jgi:hypothetical protein
MKLAMEALGHLGGFSPLVADELFFVNGGSSCGRSAPSGSTSTNCTCGCAYSRTTGNMSVTTYCAISTCTSKK